MRSFEDFLASLVVAQAQGDPPASARWRWTGSRSRISPAPRSSEAHWDAFWAFYQDTGARKWGRPYLTRDFFSLLGERMAGPDPADLRAARRAADRRRAQPDRRRGALRPLLGRGGGGSAPPFRDLLLSGDRGGDRARPAAGRGGRAGRAQARPRLPAGADLVGPPYRRSRLPATRSPTIWPPSGARSRGRSRRWRNSRRSERAERLARSAPHHL